MATVARHLQQVATSASHRFRTFSPLDMALSEQTKSEVPCQKSHSPGSFKFISRRHQVTSWSIWKGQAKLGRCFGKVLRFCGPSATCQCCVASCSALCCLGKLKKKHWMLFLVGVFFSIAASVLIPSAVPCLSSSSWSSMVFRGLHLPPL